MCSGFLERVKQIALCIFAGWIRQDRHRFYGRAQPRRIQSDVSDRPQQFCAMRNLISETRTLQNLRVGLRWRQRGKSIGLAKQRGSRQSKFWKLKEKKKTTIFSLTEKWCFPSPSKIKPRYLYESILWKVAIPSRSKHCAGLRWMKTRSQPQQSCNRISRSTLLAQLYLALELLCKESALVIVKNTEVNNGLEAWWALNRYVW